jgi:hypothetical protein
MAILKNTRIDDTGFLQLPVGSTVQRPNTPTAGSIRVNSTTGRTEYYNSNASAWVDARIPRGVVATGGNRVYDVVRNGIDYRVHIFTEGTSTFSVIQGGEIEYLIVAGGGVGGGRHAGGGGAGGVILGTLTATPQSYTIIVGAGGTGFALSVGYGGRGNNGNSSSAFGLTALGGGGGGGFADGQPTVNGAGGGSGGGGASAQGLPGGSGIGGAGTAEQGNRGGTGTSGGDWAGAGGGGAATVGRNPVNTSIGGDGGAGILSLISGTPAFYGGGGGGGGGGGPGTLNGGKGGFGGGGQGSSTYNPNAGFPGAPNTGGGGGGGRDAPGGAGGSGVVIISYKRTDQEALPVINLVSDKLFLDLDVSDFRTYSGNGTIVNDLRFIPPISGTLLNGVRPVYPASSAASFEFDGTDDHISMGSIDLRKNFSLEIWALTTRNGSWYFGQGGFSTGAGMHIGWDSAAGRGMVFGLYSNDMDTPFNLQFGLWYHFVFTYNHSTFLKQFYANGVLQKSQVQTVYSGTGQFNIGRQYSAGPGYHQGRISSVRIYEKVISSTDVQQNFEATRQKYGV